MDQRIVFEASKILRDVNAAEELAVKGYTIFPFLNQDDLEKLISYYTNIQKEEPNHFYSSTHSPDHSFRRESSNFIKKIVAERMEQFFCATLQIRSVILTLLSQCIYFPEGGV
jgi:hypothetical protein